MRRRLPKEAPIPAERNDTIRHRIASLIEERAHTGRELAAELRIPESDVYDHLEHIRRTANKGGIHLDVIPAACDHCGFVFRKRERFTKPHRCPLCRSEQVTEPLFAIRKTT